MADDEEETLLTPRREEQPPRGRRRSRPVAPPLRLAWPGMDSRIGQAATLVTSSQQLSQQSQTTTSSSSSSRKRTRRVAFRQDDNRRKQNKEAKQESSQLWVEKYTPQRTGDSSRLCVAPKKVKQVRSWIEDSFLPKQDDEKSNFVVLVGSPGVGKSTMIRVLAMEMKLTVQEWNDSQSNHFGDERHVDALLSVDYVSALNSFQQFLLSAGVGYQAVCSSTIIDSQPTKKIKARRQKQTTTTFEGKSIILLDELPNLYNAQSEVQFRKIMSQHIQQSQVPTVLVFSDVCEGKHRPADLERLIPFNLLYSPAVDIVQCHAVTRARMKKSLDEVTKAEGISPLTESALEEIFLDSGGDIRHAIMSLQFQEGAGQKHGKKASREGTGKTNNRDTKLSTFHALGKLLYAKREPSEPNGDEESAEHGDNVLLEERPPLQFDPEMVMEESSIDHRGALAFLGYHSPEFFTDSTELSQAFGHFSDAAMLLDKTMDGQRDRGDTIYPLRYVSSLAGRSVANANRHKAPNKFRSLTAPKVFEVMKKSRANEMTMKQLWKRLSVGSDVMSLDTSLGSSRTFITHNLPFMRTILPHEVNTAVDSFHSFVDRKEANKDSEDDDQALKNAILEQEQILAIDDIVDDDDSVEEPDVPSTSYSPSQNGDTSKEEPIVMTATNDDSLQDVGARIEKDPATSSSPTATVENCST